MAAKSILLTAYGRALVARAIKTKQGTEDQIPFAARMGVSAPTIRRLTTGEGPVRIQIKSLEKISVGVGWPSDMLMRIAEGEPIPGVEEIGPDGLERISRLESAVFRQAEDLGRLREMVEALARGRSDQ